MKPKKREKPDRPIPFFICGKNREGERDRPPASLHGIPERGSIECPSHGCWSEEAWRIGQRVLFKRKHLEEHISWTGNVSDQTLVSLYESSDCVVIPSRSESIPLVFSETLRFNKELIVTDVGDMGTLGRQYGVAWVIPPEDAMALKEMMERRVELQDNGKEGRNETRREELKRLFNIETSVERFLADYL